MAAPVFPQRRLRRLILPPPPPTKGQVKRRERNRCAAAPGYRLRPFRGTARNQPRAEPAAGVTGRSRRGHGDPRTSGWTGTRAVLAAEPHPACNPGTGLEVADHVPAQLQLRHRDSLPAWPAAAQNCEGPGTGSRRAPPWGGTVANARDFPARLQAPCVPVARLLAFPFSMQCRMGRRRVRCAWGTVAARTRSGQRPDPPAGRRRPRHPAGEAPRDAPRAAATGERGPTRPALPVERGHAAHQRQPRPQHRPVGGRRYRPRTDRRPLRADHNHRRRRPAPRPGLLRPDTRGTSPARRVARRAAALRALPRPAGPVAAAGRARPHPCARLLPRPHPVDYLPGNRHAPPGRARRQLLPRRQGGRRGSSPATTRRSWCCSPPGGGLGRQRAHPPGRAAGPGRPRGTHRDLPSGGRRLGREEPRPRVLVANARTHQGEQRARADLEALIETSPVGVAVLDAKSRDPVSLNAEARRIAHGLCQPAAALEECGAGCSVGVDVRPVRSVRRIRTRTARRWAGRKRTTRRRPRGKRRCRSAGLGAAGRAASCGRGVQRGRWWRNAWGSTARRGVRLSSALQAGGSDPGGADGLFGPRTRAATRAWQTQRGSLVNRANVWCSASWTMSLVSTAPRARDGSRLRAQRRSHTPYRSNRAPTAERLPRCARSRRWRSRAESLVSGTTTLSTGSGGTDSRATTPIMYERPEAGKAAGTCGCDQRALSGRGQRAGAEGPGRKRVSTRIRPSVASSKNPLHCRRIRSSRATSAGSAVRPAPTT